MTAISAIKPSVTVEPPGNARRNPDDAFSGALERELSGTVRSTSGSRSGKRPVRPHADSTGRVDSGHGPRSSHDRPETDELSSGEHVDENTTDFDDDDDGRVRGDDNHDPDPAAEDDPSRIAAQVGSADAAARSGRHGAASTEGGTSPETSGVDATVEVSVTSATVDGVSAEVRVAGDTSAEAADPNGDTSLSTNSDADSTAAVNGTREGLDGSVVDPSDSGASDSAGPLSTRTAFEQSAGAATDPADRTAPSVENPAIGVVEDPTSALQSPDGVEGDPAKDHSAKSTAPIGTETRPAASTDHVAVGPNRHVQSESQAVESTGAAASSHETRFDMSKLGEGIAGRIRTGEKVQSLTLELHPAELGGVKVDVRQVDGVTNLVLIPDRAAGGARLAAAMADLRHDLAKAGVTIGDLQLRQESGREGGGANGSGDRTGSNTAATGTGTRRRSTQVEPAGHGPTARIRSSSVNVGTRRVALDL